MGHFSYSCQLSGLPIVDYTKCVLLPIFPKKDWGYDCSQKNMSKYGLSNLCSNDGPNMYFDELFFPIFGEYDNYGRLVNIEKDDNTKVLEEFFGLSIEDISKVLTDSRKDEFDKENNDYCESAKILNKDNKKHMMLLKTSATWFHREVYEKLAKNDYHDSWCDLGVGNHGILTTLGFECIRIDKQNPRYNILYKKDNLEVYSDGNYLNVPGESIYNLKSFKKYCLKNGVDIDITKISGGLYSQLYDLILPHIKTVADFTKESKLVHMLFGDEYKVHASSYDFFESMKAHLSEEEIQKIQKKNDDENLNNLIIFYFLKIKENGGQFLRKNIIDWFNVKQFYYPSGKFLYPIGSSPQDGDPEKVKILLETSLSVVNDILEKDEHYNYDEDEDDE